MRIGIDLMGGENSPLELFDAVLDLASSNKSDTFIVFLTHEASASLTSIPENCQVILSTEHIRLEDNPLSAVRRKKDSTLLQGIRELRDGKIDALVSCGNTGALVAAANFQLSPLRHIARPALLATLPTQNGNVAVIDIGGNVFSTEEHLIECAYLGAAFQSANGDISKPRVGLLNIGAEERKGTSAHRKALQLLKAHRNPFTFLGNMEPDDVFQGTADVIVTDGFSGNVFLKTSEGLARYLYRSLQPLLKERSQELDAAFTPLRFENYPGALLCGVKEIVVKCHSYSNSSALKQGILGAMNWYAKGVLSAIAASMQDASLPRK